LAAEGIKPRYTSGAKNELLLTCLSFCECAPPFPLAFIIEQKIVFASIHFWIFNEWQRLDFYDAALALTKEQKGLKTRTAAAANNSLALDYYYRVGVYKSEWSAGDPDLQLNAKSPPSYVFSFVLFL
jgi:hypothetical protein